MRKYILSLLAMMLISSAAFAQSVAKVQGMKVAKGKPQPAKVAQPFTNEDLPDGEAYAYAYLFYQTSLQTRGIINFSTTDPQHYSLRCDYGAHTHGDIGFYNGTFVKDRYFAQSIIVYNNGAIPEYNSPQGLAEVDPVTGEQTLVGSWKASFDSHINDLAYDDDNDALLGCMDNNDGASSSFYKIDYKNPDNTPVFLGQTKTGMVIQTLAADNGYLYALANGFNGTDYTAFASCSLYRFKVADILAGTVDPELIGVVKMPSDFISYGSTMAMDKMNHRLYACLQPEDGNAYWAELDYTNGNLKKCEQITSGLQYFGLDFPYQSVAKGAPSYLRNFKAAAGAQGALNATFSWTLPTVAAEGSNLADAITGINVYRDGVKVATLGAVTSWTDNEVTTGNHEYKFHAVNAKGEGQYSGKTLFVGVDRVGDPLNAKVTAKGTTATITWEAPSKGVNGGYFDPNGLTYSVTRNDGKEIAKDITETTITDEEEVTAPYYYTITVKNEAGVGGSAKTNTISFGTGYNLPFSSAFDSELAFGFWNVIDGFATQDGNSIFTNSETGEPIPDGTTWKWDEIGFSAIYYGGGNGACDFLVSPALKMKKDVEYRFEYKYMIEPYKDCYESFEVVISKDPTFAGLCRMVDGCKAVVLDEYIDKNDFTTRFIKCDKKFTVDADGTYYIAFYMKSKGNMGSIHIKDVNVREYMDNDLTAQSLECSDQSRPDKNTNVRIKVLNNGRKTVAGASYKVKVINADNNEVLAEGQGKDVDPDKEVNVAAVWVPEFPGTYNIKGLIDFEADGYKDDNTTTQTFTVEVSNDAENTTDWVSVGFNDLNGMASDGSTYFDSLLGMPMASGKSFILYDKEMLGVEDAFLTHIRYMYDGDEACEGIIEYPISVKVATTDDQYMPIIEDPKVVEDGDIGYGPMAHQYGFTEVFNGEVDLSAPGRNNWLTIELDEPYYVSGDENIIINLNSLSQTSGETVHWHCYRTDNFIGAVVGVKDSNYIDAIYYHVVGAEDWYYAAGIRPYTRLGFSDDIEGVKSVKYNKANDNAVYNLQGQRVNEKSLTSGIYVKNGKKFIVK